MSKTYETRKQATSKVVIETPPAWREAGAALNDAYADAIGKFIAQCEDVTALFEFLGDEKTCLELRQVKGLMKSKASDFKQAADSLRG